MSDAKRAAVEKAADAPAKKQTWLILVYRVPTEPTRHRAAVWRRLRNLGAVYLQNSVAAMPRTVDSERALRALRNEIVEKMEGKAFLLTSSALAGEGEMVAIVNAARDDEYEEILDKCGDFHRELSKEVAAEHFTYGELEENEEDLNKLLGWFQKVRTRDALGSDKAAVVEEALVECSKALEDFAARVYAAEDES